MTPISPSLLAKFAPALLPLAVALFGPLQLFLADNVFTSEEIWTFVGLASAALLTWVLPLVKTGWAGIFKVGINLLGALSALVIPLLGGEWTAAVWIGVIIGLIQALAAQIGVDIRLDAQKEVIDSRSNPDVPTITSLDPEALRVVEATPITR